jgi:HD superfamily phosphohydrolase
MPDYKIINDPIHGGIRVEGVHLDLLQTPEVQRLAGIRQLGLTYLVFPGANHTRIEHSIGTYWVASRIARELGLDQHERDLVSVAALLHDVGHGPYSHTLESILHSRYGIDHMEVTKDIILGKRENVSDGRDSVCKDTLTIPQVLEKHKLDPQDVAELVTGGDYTGEVTLEDFQVQDKQAFFNEKRYLGQIVHSAFDSDQVDYLLRDSHYTGVAHGTIDLDRLMLTMELFNNDLVIHRRGIAAIEGMLVARSLMYSSVYFHKAVRISELMLANAVEHMKEERPEIQGMVDSELMENMKTWGDYQKDIVIRLKYRRLFKRAFSIDFTDLDDDIKSKLSEISEPRVLKAKEQEICRKANVPEGYVLIDIPQRELLISEPRIKMTDVKVRDGDGIKPLSRLSPLGRALQAKVIPEWVVMVSTDEEYVDAVQRAAKVVLLGE